MHVGIAGVLLARDDLVGAAEHLAAGRRVGEHKGLPQNGYRWRVVSARLHEAEGDLDGALELLDAAERVYNGDFSPNVQPVSAVRARLRLRRGELDDAAAWARERGLSAEDEPSYLREYEHVTLARLLLARYHADRDDIALAVGSRLLDRLLACAEAGGREATVIEVLVLRALAHHAGGDLPAGLAALHRAVTLGQADGYVRVFAGEGAPMATLLRALLRRQAAGPSSGYLRRLLAATTRGDHSVPPHEARWSTRCRTANSTC
jgi:LuxR family maltose regulon positive regulatory protein